MDLDFVSVHKHAKKELGQYPAILTSHLVNNPYLLTEREGRTGEYWPEVVAVRTERSEVRTKRPRANIPRYGSS